jgi:hypothetical protein
VYSKLFDSDSKYRQVSNFLSEFLVNVLPKDFMTGKNKKVLDKKILSFVKFNRFETFTKITLLEGLDTQKVAWLKFKAKDENKQYFRNENNWILWHVLKWIFEDILISLMRCFFYCTEKQKEYSRMFYYRKAIWSKVMTMSIEDLLKETLKSVDKKEMNA